MGREAGKATTTMIVGVERGEEDKEEKKREESDSGDDFGCRKRTGEDKRRGWEQVQVLLMERGD